ncbi:MAG TPA: hypothetical protein PLY70_06315 [Saprospiraceae bacterium]|nr:hypothetical protein [Saprospiraceae bacterium]HPN71053.1 hypothetical protein [Saprospiraceae bacterium]
MLWGGNRRNGNWEQWAIGYASNGQWAILQWAIGYASNGQLAAPAMGNWLRQQWAIGNSAILQIAFRPFYSFTDARLCVSLNLNFLLYELSTL